MGSSRSKVKFDANPVGSFSVELWFVSYGETCADQKRDKSNLYNDSRLKPTRGDPPLSDQAILDTAASSIHSFGYFVNMVHARKNQSYSPPRFPVFSDSTEWHVSCSTAAQQSALLQIPAALPKLEAAVKVVKYAYDGSEPNAPLLQSVCPLSNMPLASPLITIDRPKEYTKEYTTIDVPRYMELLSRVQTSQVVLFAQVSMSHKIEEYMRTAVATKVAYKMTPGQVRMYRLAFVSGKLHSAKVDDTIKSPRWRADTAGVNNVCTRHPPCKELGRYKVLSLG